MSKATCKKDSCSNEDKMTVLHIPLQQQTSAPDVDITSCVRNDAATTNTNAVGCNNSSNDDGGEDMEKSSTFVDDVSELTDHSMSFLARYEQATAQQRQRHQHQQQQQQRQMQQCDEHTDQNHSTAVVEQKPDDDSPSAVVASGISELQLGPSFACGVISTSSNNQHASANSSSSNNPTVSARTRSRTHSSGGSQGAASDKSKSRGTTRKGGGGSRDKSRRRASCDTLTTNKSGQGHHGATDATTSSKTNSESSTSLLLSIAGHHVLEQQKQIDVLKEENITLKQEKNELTKQMEEMRLDKEEKNRVVAEALRTMSKQQELLVDLMAQQEILKRKLAESEKKLQSSSISLPTSPEPSKTRQKSSNKKRGSMI